MVWLPDPSAIDASASTNVSTRASTASPTRSTCRCASSHASTSSDAAIATAPPYSAQVATAFSSFFATCSAASFSALASVRMFGDLEL